MDSKTCLSNSTSHHYAVAMLINALFALLSAAATDFTTLVLCRTLAGVGVSGSNTVRDGLSRVLQVQQTF